MNGFIFPKNLRQHSYIHDQFLCILYKCTGGDVWVLSIKNVRFNDSGLYACEVNSDPVVRSFHSLSGKLNDNNITFNDNHIKNKNKFNSSVGQPGTTTI